MTDFKQVKNNVRSIVSDGALDNTTPSLSFNVDTGSIFPIPGNGFYVTVWDNTAYYDPTDDPNMRIGLCSARTGNSLTVTWGQLGTPINAIEGTPMLAMLIEDQHFGDIHDAINALELDVQDLEDEVNAIPGLYVQMGGDLGGSATSPLTKSRTTTVTVARDTDMADYLCDGTADQVQIQQAIDAVFAAGGGTVYIRKGTYSIADTIEPKSNVHIKGEGMFLTKLVATSGTGTGAIMGDTSYTVASPLTHFKLTDLELDGTAMPTTPSYQIGRKGFEGNNIVHSVFQNLYIHNTPASGLGIDNLYKVLVDHCFIESCGTAGQSQGSNGVGIGTGGFTHESVVVTNCITKGIANSAYLVEDLESVTDAERSYIFSNNVSIGDKIGFSNSGCRNVIFANNTVYGATAIGIRALNFATHISDHTVVKNNIVNAATSYGIYMDSGVNNYVIEGNIVRNGTVEGIILYGGYGNVQGNLIHNNGKHGIIVFCPSASYPISHLNIQNNTIYNNAQITANTDGIRLDATNANITDVQITGNHCFDDQAVKTQRYGIILASGTMSNITVTSNNLLTNKTGAMFTNTSLSSYIIRNNLGIAEIVTKTGNYTITPLDLTVLGDTTSGNITLTLPTSVGKKGVIYNIKKIASANTMNIATTSSQTVDGSTSIAVTAQNESLALQSDDANWIVI